LDVDVVKSHVAVPHLHHPALPISLEQLLATQNDLMRRLVENEHQQPRHQEKDSSYSNFLATHPPVFADATNPLEADS
jgi:hypothetical protein